MNIEELKYQILQQFGFPPTSEQAQALDVFVQFMTDSNPHAVMILRRPAREGINPATKEKIQIAAKKVAKFKAGAELADAINK